MKLQKKCINIFNTKVLRFLMLWWTYSTNLKMLFFIFNDLKIIFKNFIFYSIF